MRRDPALRSYILCATPRSGSTLLCATLAATSVAGRPHSFYHPAFIEDWADGWGVPRPDGTEIADFDRRFLVAALREGGADSGVFGLRLMWDHLAEASRRLARALGRDGDAVSLLSEAFGPPIWIHLSRPDKVAQAVSRLRAERTGLWHRAADGSILEQMPATGPVAYDRQRLAEIEAGLHHDERAWTAFFAAHAIEPLSLAYDTVAADPRSAAAAVLSALGLDPIPAHQVPVPTARLADEISQEWVERFRHETGR